MDNQKIAQRSIQVNSSLLDALKLMDSNKVKLLLVFDDQKFSSILTIGDVQRAIINNIELARPISEILDIKKVYANQNSSFDDVKQKMLQLRSECMPVVNVNGELLDVYFWEDVFSINQQVNNEKIDLPVVIMAGGKGERLKPITNVIPKPLIPIGEKTILELIMDKFGEIGCTKFYATVNYKADFIKYYFETLQTKSYDISYIKEDKPLGTIGSLYLLKDIINTTFFVSNCDIIIDQDFRDVYDYHVSNGNEVTVIGALKHYHIPYGILETGKDGVMERLSEKPDLTFMINSGVYILEPHLIKEIPENTFFHITQLIEKVLSRNGKVGVFPVTEGSWRDIGQWDLFLQNNRIR